MENSEDCGLLHFTPHGVFVYRWVPSVVILDVVHNNGFSWNTKTEVDGLFKKLPEYVEEQEIAARVVTPATTQNEELGWS